MQAIQHMFWINQFLTVVSTRSIDSLRLIAKASNPQEIQCRSLAFGKYIDEDDKEGTLLHCSRWFGSTPVSGGIAPN